MDAPDALWRSSRVRALIDAGDIGGVVRLARQARGWRQADLGKATGYSASTISRLETGQRACTDLDMLRGVARAVGIPHDLLGALIGLRSPAPVTVARIVGRPAEEDDPMRRRTLMTAAGLAVPIAALVAIDDALALLPDPTRAANPSQLAARLVKARRRFDTGDLARLVTELPDLLATAHQATQRGDNPAGYARVAASYDLATEALSKIGRYGAARITADRASAYAALSGEPIFMAAAARSLSIVLRHEGRHQIAERVTVEAAARLDDTGLITPAQAAAFAQMLCTCAYSAAQANDRHRALEMITDAERAAARLPAYPIDGQPFTVTPAQVALYRVGVHWSLGDAGAALQAGHRLRPAQFPTPERRGRLHTDLARAWWQWNKPEQTIHALLAAHNEAPAEVRDRPSIRTMATELIERHPRTTGVRELAAAIGHRRTNS